MQSCTRSNHGFPRAMLRCRQTLLWGMFLALAVLLLAGCGGEDATPTPTRTPIPTYTPTPVGSGPAPQVVTADTPSAPAAPTPAPTDTPTPVPPTDTPTPLPPTDTPTATPSPSPTATPSPTPTPTPTPDYAFELEAAEQFPSTVEEVRIYAYVYAEDSPALAGYSLRVTKDGEPREVLATSAGGLPGETRPEPGPYTRFANLGVAFFEPPAGEWVVQLVDRDGNPVGPPARFMLEPEDPRRELYVRYRRK